METPKEFLEGFDPQIKEVGYDNYLYTPQQVIGRLEAYRKELVRESDSLPCVSGMFSSEKLEKAYKDGVRDALTRGYGTFDEENYR